MWWWLVAATVGWSSVVEVESRHANRFDTLCHIRAVCAYWPMHVPAALVATWDVLVAVVFGAPQEYAMSFA